jgi:hypothetical protein
MQLSDGYIYYERRGGEGMDTQSRAAISANVPLDRDF